MRGNRARSEHRDSVNTITGVRTSRIRNSIATGVLASTDISTEVVMHRMTAPAGEMGLAFNSDVDVHRCESSSRTRQ